MMVKRSFSEAKFDKLIKKHFEDVSDNMIAKKNRGGLKFFDYMKARIEERYKGITDVRKSKRYYNKKDKNSYYIQIYFINNIIDTIEISLLYDKGLVTFSHYNNKLGSFENLYKFIDEYIIKIEEEVKVAQKKNKVKKLKTNATLAKIEELASELQFSYIIIDEYVTKVKLVVKFEKSLAVEIDVTISKYKKILENLKELILSIRKLQDLGIKTRWKSTSRYSESSWIKPEPLTDI